MEHKERMERRAYLMRKRHPRYHVTHVYGDNRVMGKQSNDLAEVTAAAEAKAPAYVIDNWARPTPEVVHVALPPDAPTNGYMSTV